MKLFIVALKVAAVSAITFLIMDRIKQALASRV